MIGPSFKSHAHCFGQLPYSGKCETVTDPAGPAEPALEVEAWPGDGQHLQKTMERNAKQNKTHIPGEERAYVNIRYP